MTESRGFELSGFIEILRERMYTKDTFARAYHLSWIEAIEKVSWSLFRGLSIAF